LVENYAIGEHALAVKYDPGIVKVIQKMPRTAYTGGFIAKLLELLLRQRTILALLRRHRSIRIAQCIQPLLNSESTTANRRETAILPDPGRSLT
jgi:hypothetical protein